MDPFFIGPLKFALNLKGKKLYILVAILCVCSTGLHIYNSHVKKGIKEKIKYGKVMGYKNII